ncbi:MAG: flagellin hook IN motif-containing protein [Planctomycetota bacterium]
MTANPVNVSGFDRVAGLRTAAAVQRPVSVGFGGLSRGSDAADLTSISTLFQRLAAARVDQSGSAAFAAEADKTAAAIEQIVNIRDPRGPSFTFDGPPGVLDVSAKGVSIASTATLDVTVLASAQQGSLYLSLGIFGVSDNGLNLNGSGAAANSTFSIEIGGAVGSRLFTFSSGQTLSQIAAAINTFTDETGIDAQVATSAQRGGIALQSSGFGEREFVSVGVIDDADLRTTNNGTRGLGVYGFFENNASLNGQALVDGKLVFGGIDASTLISFDEAFNSPVVDLGQSVSGMVNGLAALGRGTTLFANEPSLGGVFRIELGTDPRQFGSAVRQSGFQIRLSGQESGPGGLTDGSGSPGGLPRIPLDTSG